MKAIANIIRRTGTLLGLGLLGLCGPRAQAATAIPLANNGDPANRVDFVFVSEGYRASEMGKFAADAENARQMMFAQEPFKEYQKFFNVYRVEQASNNSGSDHPERVPPVAVDTAFDSGYGCGAIDRLICADNNKVNSALSGVLQANQRDVVVLLVNDETYGGSGGSIAVASTNAAVVELVLHEIGHSFGLLADEYGSEPAPGPVTSEPSEANATQQTARASIKWRAWISDSTALPTTAQVNGVPGAYQGARYQPTALYRPTLNSKMRALDAPFEQINTEQFVKRYYNLVSPIDSFSPAAGTVEAVRGDSKTFSIASPQPLTHALTVKWTFNGAPVASGANFTLQTSGLAPGQYTLRADVADETAMVRSDPNGVLRDSHGWIVDVKSAPVTLNSPSILEGAPGTSASLTFTATLEKPSSSPVTVNYATSDDSAVAGKDYVAASGTLSFAPGETSASFAVSVIGDALVETDESFRVTLSSDTLIPTGGTGTITNDDFDSAQPSVSILTPANRSFVTRLDSISGAATSHAVGSNIARVELFFKRNSDGKYWTGTAWGNSTAVALSTTLQGSAWSKTSELPLTNTSDLSKKLLDGSYLLTATAYDSAGNRKSASHFWTLDKINPAVTITTPVNQSFVTALQTIAGSATDNQGGSGVARLDVFLRRNSDSRYWTGTAWGTTSPVALSAGLNKSAWGITSAQLPSPTASDPNRRLGDGTYLVSATAYDKAGNQKSIGSFFTLDRINPAVSISTPANRSFVTSLASVSGTATDPGGSGIARVDVFLKRNRDGVYWTGTAWGTTAPTTLFVGLNKGNWGLTSAGLPSISAPDPAKRLSPGDYTFYATAYDRAFNQKSTSNFFTVTKAGPPAASAPQS